MISLRARLIRLLSRQMFKNISGETSVLALRKSWEELAARFRPASGTDVTYATIAGVACDWLAPTDCDDAPVLCYVHGGAYVTGSSRTHRAMVSHIAREAGVRAVLPNYRLAPEHPFPAGLHDCVGVYRALLGSGIDASRIAIAGDSAGGGMTMAVLLSLRDAGEPLPAAACLLSPWLDLAGEGATIQTRAKEDPWFRGEHMPQTVAHYCEEAEIRNPLVSPVYADVHGLPPIFIQVGDHEILLSDATRIADKLSAAGGDVTLQVWPEMWHVFQYFVGKMPESRRAIRDIGTFLRTAFDATAGEAAESVAA